MNSRVLFYNVFLFLTLLSCSHDGGREIDDIGEATLSLRITIPQIGTKAGDSAIGRLYVAIFGTSGENADKLIVAREVTQTDTIEDITPLKAGTIRMLLVANAPEGTFNALTSLDQFLALTQKLENEDTAPTMSSGVHSYVLKPGKNTIGLQKEGAHLITASPVTIYRTVARIYLNKLFLRPLEEYADQASFKLESVFMANVKNYSHYISENDWGAVEVTDHSFSDFFLTGENADLESIYKEKAPKLSADLRTVYNYDFRNVTEETGLIANCASNTYTVYENMQETTWHTLLVIRGTYRYKDKNGMMQEIKNIYYPIVVNRQHDDITNVTEHLYVRRNVIYSIDAIIKGPYSDTTLTSMVEVQAWGEIVENPSID
ncbi:fimbrial protein [uncultured Parabacteroides sp.]|uniref:fimbrial protein n=1 Tax=uncultured Parabacteroides sp. TaxID=512312 RepID=UPI0025EBE390|nr:fimbrial protein [uncultured Parabacteroides sp.]